MVEWNPNNAEEGQGYFYEGLLSSNYIVTYVFFASVLFEIIKGESMLLT